MVSWQIQAHVWFAARGIRVDSIASEPTPIYNCIAWAVEETKKRWWPDPNPGWHWPLPIAGDTVNDFVAMFRTRGYEVCADGALEPGFKKIAIYADHAGHVKHAARQLPSGEWTSKLGRFVDVLHTPDQLEGARAAEFEYGSVAQYMRCPSPALPVQVAPVP